jgi:phenylpyruvate tautomerase PptA (4-oxalocrotonate tautomerase family)
LSQRKKKRPKKRQKNRCIKATTSMTLETLHHKRWEIA